MAGAAIQPVQPQYTPAPAPPTRVPVAQLATNEVATPRWLAVSVALTWATIVVFVIVAIVAVRQHRDALNTIANSSAKSVIAAQRIATSFADMDANAANTLLNPQQKDQSIKAYHESRKLMTDALVDAAHNITFDNEEEQVKVLADQGNQYGARVESAFTMQASGGKTAVARYLDASSVMDKSLLPGAAKLDEINRGELDKSFNWIQQVSMVQKALVWIMGLVALALLIRVQFFLSERMHRTLNPLCLAATLLIAGLLLYTYHSLTTASDEIRHLKADAFDSVHALWKAKAVAYEANAQESRYLLDKTGAAADEKRFAELANLMVSDPTRLAYVTKPGPFVKPPDSVQGYLADELRNITFPGEQEAAIDATSSWLQYVKIDGQIRALEQAGQHDKALALCLGEETDQSNWAFKNLISDLDKALKINQDQFDFATKRGFDALYNFEIIGPVMGLLAALACLFGVLPRIREYSA